MTNEYARSVVSQLVSDALYHARWIARGGTMPCPEWLDAENKARHAREALETVNHDRGELRNYVNRAYRIRCIIVTPVRPLPLP
jgi:hypothetical protein